MLDMERCQLDIAKSIKTETDLNTIHEALKSFEKLQARYPKTLKELVPNYINKLPVSVWEPGYQYKANSNSYELFSLGSDAAAGGKGASRDHYGNMNVREIILSIRKNGWGCNA